ncbi:MAG: hypothetical protein IH626_04105 [Rhodospirillales bacterium]|nr:hypothetical protein [Rhodospirillales bacterium]
MLEIGEGPRKADVGHVVDAVLDGRVPAVGRQVFVEDGDRQSVKLARRALAERPQIGKELDQRDSPEGLLDSGAILFDEILFRPFAFARLGHRGWGRFFHCSAFLKSVIAAFPLCAAQIDATRGTDYTWIDLFAKRPVSSGEERVGLTRREASANVMDIMAADCR